MNILKNKLYITFYFKIIRYFCASSGLRLVIIIIISHMLCLLTLKLSLEFYDCVSFDSGERSMRESIRSRRTSKRPLRPNELWARHPLQDHSEYHTISSNPGFFCSYFFPLGFFNIISPVNWFQLTSVSACSRQELDLPIMLKKTSFPRLTCQANSVLPRVR